MADGLPDTSTFTMFDRNARDSIYSLVTVTEDGSRQPSRRTSDVTEPITRHSTQMTDVATEIPVSIRQLCATEPEENDETAPPEPPPLPTEEQMTATEGQTVLY